MSLVWLVIAIVFAVAELMTASLTLIWFSIAAIILIFVSKIVESIIVQTIIFGIISTVLLVVATKKFIKQDENYKYNTNLQAIINEKGFIKEEINPQKVGIVSLGGEDWSAISIDNETILKGEHVRVLKIEGVKLVVEKIK